MGRTILSMMTTLDGSIARADGDLGWFLSDAEFEEEMLGLLAGTEAMLFGRVAYEMLAAYWPAAGEEAAEEAPGGFSSRERRLAFAHLMNSIPKVVYSRTLERADWGPARIVRGGIAEDLAETRARATKHLVLFAGAAIARTFLDLDLCDEIRLMVHPIVLAGGVRPFDGLAAERTFRHVRTRTFPSGVVLLQQQRDRARGRGQGM